jgi:hypothetical protein
MLAPPALPSEKDGCDLRLSPRRSSASQPIVVMLQYPLPILQHNSAGLPMLSETSCAVHFT